MLRHGFASLFLLVALPAQVLRVPSQHASIGAALAAASSGTTILVGPGTYTETLTWPARDGIRLVSEAGSAQTKIDAAQLGRPLTFGSAVITRKTVVDGFEITGGLQSTTSGRNNGAGILVSGASPTLIRNRITGNVSDGTSWNYGGGIHVSGAANPLIIANLVENNELRNGSWNYGAGIYVDTGASAEIVGNTIRANKNLSPASGSGNRGHGAGIYAGGTNVVIASNLIVDNANNVTAWNYGGGILANAGGTLTIVNNTIVGNKCTGGFWIHGAGIYATGSGGSLVITGNIVAKNAASGASSQGAGGLHSSALTTALTLDWNDVWQNTGGDYVGFTKGANDLGVDPLFASATSYDLAQASPLVDAMPPTWLPANVGIDYRGGSRRSDGNGDGLPGNAARLDIGAAELSGAALSLSGAMKLGTTPLLQITAGLPSRHVVALDIDLGVQLVEPAGYLLLSQNFVTLATGVTPATLPMTIPTSSALAGLTVHFQGATTTLANPYVGSVTNVVSATIF